MMSEIREKLAAYLHYEWKEKREEQGYHLPGKCPNFEKQRDEDIDTMDSDMIHCNKCDINMCDFSILEKTVKNDYLKKADNMLISVKIFGLKIIEG
jgi:hypothetical protein